MTAWPNQREGDFVLKDYVFTSGETLPELKLHYTSLGTPHRNAGGEIDNAACCCTAPAARARTGCYPRSRTSCSAPASRSTPRATSSSCPTASAAAARASRAMACARRSRITAIATSSRRSTACSPSTSASGICGWCSAARWAACIAGCGAGCIPASWTRWCRSPASRSRSRPQLDLAAHRHRGDPQRSRLERGQLHGKPDALHPHRAVRLADDRERRPAAGDGQRRARRRTRSTGNGSPTSPRGDANDQLYATEAVMDYDPAPLLGRSRRSCSPSTSPTTRSIRRSWAWSSRRSGRFPARGSCWCRRAPIRTGTSRTCRRRSGSRTLRRS